jgi:hypothetical protein
MVLCCPLAIGCLSRSAHNSPAVPRPGKGAETLGCRADRRIFLSNFDSNDAASFSATLELLALAVTLTRWEVADFYYGKSACPLVGICWLPHTRRDCCFPLDSVDFNPYPACWMDSLFWRWDNSIRSPLPSVLCQLAETLTDTHAALLMAPTTNRGVRHGRKSGRLPTDNYDSTPDRPEVQEAEAYWIERRAVAGSALRQTESEGEAGRKARGSSPSPEDDPQPLTASRWPPE